MRSGVRSCHDFSTQLFDSCKGVYSKCNHCFKNSVGMGCLFLYEHGNAGTCCKVIILEWASFGLCGKEKHFRSKN